MLVLSCVAPGLPAASTTPTTLQTSTQSASSSSSGLSHGGKVALATVLPIVGVIAIVAAVAFIIMRRRGSSSRTLDSPNSNRVSLPSIIPYARHLSYQIGHACSPLQLLHESHVAS